MIYLSCFVIAASQVFLTIILSYIVRKLPDSEKQGENNETNWNNRRDSKRVKSKSVGASERWI
jgi:hypothetical protein